MTSRRRRAIRLVSLALMLLVAVGIAAWFGQDGKPHLTLSDGRQISVVAITFGTEHKYSQGPVLLRAFERVLPGTWKKRLGLRVLTHRTDTPSLMVWTEWNGLKVHPPAYDANVIDRAGVQSDPRRFALQAYPPDGKAILAWKFANFPRRQRTLDVGFLDRGNDHIPHQVARMTIRNPVSKDYPQWPVAALPQRGASSDCEFVLSEWVVRKTLPSLPALSWGQVTPWTLGTFSVQCGGVPLSACEVVEVQVRDATGNYQSVAAYGPAWGLSQPDAFAARPALWADEAAFKLKVAFVRSANFLPTKLISAKGILVPQPGQVTIINQRASLEAVQVSIRSLTRPARAPISPDPAVRRRGELDVSVLPRLDGLELTLVAVTGANGKPLQHSRMRDVLPGEHKFAVELPADSESLDVTLAVHKIRWVELMATPNRTASGPAPKL